MFCSLYVTRLDAGASPTLEVLTAAATAGWKLRLASWEAEQMVAETKSPARRRRKPLDDVAAAILLRDYLERTRGVARSAAAEKV